MRKALVVLVCAVVALAGCAAKIADGKIVKVNYTGTLDDGTVFDSSEVEGGTPLEFMIGAGNMIPDFERNLLGLKVGEKKTFTIKAIDAYGERDESMIADVPLDSFPDDLELEEGMQLVSQGDMGTMVVTVKELTKTSAMIDYNHPLAGKDLTFAITVVSVRNPTKEELAAQQAAEQQALEPQ